MEKSNGKIAIAIVAMFVVALSIIGFTYAYFVAQVDGNDGNEVVEVQAGILKVVYDNGNVILAEDIVPGWKNDGKMIYDPIHSVTNVDGETRIAAVSTDELAAANKTISDGATDPVPLETFTVTDASTLVEDEEEPNVAYYGIRLTGVKNGLYDKDQQTSEYLYEESERNDLLVTLKDQAGNVVVTDYVLTGESTQYIYANPIEIYTEAGETDRAVHNYELMVHYVNDGVQTAQGIKFEAKVEVVGLQLVDGAYKTATGEVWADLVAGA